MESKLTFEEIGTYFFRVSFNKKDIGRLFQSDDGFYYYDPLCQEGESGLWAAWWMRQIADKLDELNKPWDDHINEYFKNQKE